MENKGGISNVFRSILPVQSRTKRLLRARSPGRSVAVCQ